MKYLVYKITNKIDGKIYIGQHQTTNIHDDYMGSGKLLRRAQKKHGIENFVKEILHVFNIKEEMNAKEAELVTEEFCLREDTYNICPGGYGGFGYINQNGLNNANKDKQQIYTRVSMSLKCRVRPLSSQSLKEQYRTGKRVAITKPQHGNSYASKKIRCLKTGIVYNSVKEAAIALGITPGCVTRHKRDGKYEVV